ncbi:hypothetical protein NB688_000594 [Xanthomonas sacchari]|uniref:Phage tail protein n=1 Tax=Xanthomonas sacchari TaxID=56458 RepID=A0ABT3DTG1_9XANT|nr:hypothetical protein [Xanthomonas sacchari]MCW0398780.1 hypothetical protein [Xanthomonas sacchari]MCW0418428.1 hypothetical protein [Xanthomonas sacchari]UYK72509.1 hypothetical protein NG828_20370 [Xanthomonas sacchari]
MANIRFSDKPQLAALFGSEAIPAQSVAGGTDTGGNAVAAGNDVRIPVAQLAAFCAAYRRAVATINQSSSGALTVDYSLGDYFIVNLAANVTGITISNPPAATYGGSIRIRFVQDSTGGRSVVLPSSAKAITGTDTSVQSAAGAQTVLHLTTDDGGNSWAYSMKAVAA